MKFTDVTIACDGCMKEVGPWQGTKEARLQSRHNGFRRVKLEKGGYIDYCPDCLKKYAAAIK